MQGNHLLLLHVLICLPMHLDRQALLQQESFILKFSFLQFFLCAKLFNLPFVHHRVTYFEQFFLISLLLLVQAFFYKPV